MVIKVLLTLDIDEDEYRMPADGNIETEINEAMHEFIYDIDGLEINTIRLVSEYLNEQHLFPNRLPPHGMLVGLRKKIEERHGLKLYVDTWITL